MAGRKKSEPGGLPDGLVVGVIAVLLGVTLLVWTATGISALLAHGHWPAHVHFTRTPQAMRQLATQPHDIPAAWPAAPPAELPDSGLFWGIFVAQFMVLLVLGVWVLGVIARIRSGRGRTRTARPARVPRQRRGGKSVPLEASQEYGSGYESGDEQDGAAYAESAGHGTRGADGAGPDGARTAPGGRAARRSDPDSLDAWFRTVPQAVPPGARDDSPTAVLDPAAAGGPAPAAAAPTAPHTDLLAGTELTRTYVLFAGPRGDQAKRVVQPAVLAAAGPVVVTTADPDTYHQTVGNRAKLGPVHVYDPAHRLDVPGRLRWAPHAGCEQPGTARIRAAALLAPLRTDRADEAIVHATAATLLRCWLHAAAVDGLPFRQLHRWAASGTAAGEAVRILRTATAAASGWSGELESVLHAHPERRDAAQALIRRILEPLTAVHIRDACSPGRTGGLDLESFTAERGTLYVVGERIEDPRSHPGAMPLLTALVSCVVEHGRHMAAGSSAGRLDPPLSFVLDDIAALAPLPELPSLLAEGRASGLPALAVLRSPEQALARWGEPLWPNADEPLRLDDGLRAYPPPGTDPVR